MKRLLPVLMGFVFLLLSPTEGWSLPRCADTAAKSIQETRGWDNCFGRLHIEKGKFKGWTYIGEFKNDKFNGQGTFTFPSGEKHVGKWKNQLPNGQGVHTYTDGRIEEGIFENGKFLDTKKLSPTN